MLTIYHWEPNANSGKPLLAAAEKGVAYESRYVDMLAFDHHQPAYLEINPRGTIPAMVHDGRSVAESTVMMEYIDMAFDGQPLRPADPYERWRMRWWGRFLDQFIGPSVSQFGWSLFVGPAVRTRDPEELKAAIDRIPMVERQTAWRKAIYGLFSEEELAESRRRVLLGVRMLEEALSDRPWIAGESYSLADIAGFNMLAGVPALLPDAASDATTPHLMEWLRKINERPAARIIREHGRTPMMHRYIHLDRPQRGNADA